MSDGEVARKGEPAVASGGEPAAAEGEPRVLCSSTSRKVGLRRVGVAVGDAGVDAGGPDLGYDGWGGRVLSLPTMRRRAS
ncbi:hypothetical protein [Pilimelia columellifera]|uniref:hypothetical protein n=1 Tax=Pilimelia columellifera TaxID=706574 RepID=UPI0031CE4F46